MKTFSHEADKDKLQLHGEQHVALLLLNLAAVLAQRAKLSSSSNSSSF